MKNKSGRFGKYGEIKQKDRLIDKDKSVKRTGRFIIKLNEHRRIGAGHQGQGRK